MVPDFNNKVVENCESEDEKGVIKIDDDDSAILSILNNYGSMLNELHKYTFEILDSEKWKIFKRILGNIIRGNSR